MDHNRKGAHLTRSDGRFKKCCIFSAVDGTDNDMLWNGSEESVRKKKAPTVKMEVTPIGKGRSNLTCCTY